MALLQSRSGFAACLCLRWLIGVMRHHLPWDPGGLPMAGPKLGVSVTPVLAQILESCGYIFGCRASVSLFDEGGIMTYCVADAHQLCLVAPHICGGRNGGCSVAVLLGLDRCCSFA